MKPYFTCRRRAERRRSRWRDGCEMIRIDMMVDVDLVVGNVHLYPKLVRCRTTLLYGLQRADYRLGSMSGNEVVSTFS